MFIYFLLQQKKVTKKTCSDFKYFLYFLPDADYGACATTSPLCGFVSLFAPAYMRRLKAASPHASSLRSCVAVTQSPLCHLLRLRSYTAPLPSRAIRLYLVQSGFSLNSLSSFFQLPIMFFMSYSLF